MNKYSRRLPSVLWTLVAILAAGRGFAAQPQQPIGLFYYDPSTVKPVGQTLQTDVCIYGGTSAGVSAALQLSHMGKKAILLEPSGHLGGLSSGGLGATDIGNKRAIGGISREFYRRLGKK